MTPTLFESVRPGDQIRYIGNDGNVKRSIVVSVNRPAHLVVINGNFRRPQCIPEALLVGVTPKHRTVAEAA
jgi:hypothetical protein